MLRIASAAGVAAADARARVDLEFRGAGRVKVFDRDGPLPEKRVLAGVDVDAGRGIDEVSHVGGHADGGCGAEGAFKIGQRALPRTGCGDIAEVHAVAEDLAIDRGAGKAERNRGDAGLSDDIVDEQKCFSDHGTWFPALLKSNGAHDGGGGDGDRAGIDRAVGQRGRAAICGVADRAARGAVADGEIESRGITPARLAERRVCDKTLHRRRVGIAGRGHIHEADIALGVGTSVAHVAKLGRVVGEDRDGVIATHAVALREREAGGGRVEFEIRVQVRLREGAGVVLPGDSLRGQAVFRGGKDDRVLVGGERPCGKGPLVWDSGVVGQVIGAEVDGCIGRVPNLDPVGKRAVFIGQRFAIVRHELRDEHLSAHEGRGRCVARLGGAQERPLEIRANPRQFDFRASAEAVADEFDGNRWLRERDRARRIARILRAVIEDHVLAVDAQPATQGTVDGEDVFARRIDDQRAGDLYRVVGGSRAGEIAVARGVIAIHTVREIDGGKTALRRFVEFVLFGAGPRADEAERALQVALIGEGERGAGKGEDPACGEARGGDTDGCGLVDDGGRRAGPVIIGGGEGVGRREQRRDGH